VRERFDAAGFFIQKLHSVVVTREIDAFGCNRNSCPVGPRGGDLLLRAAADRRAYQHKFVSPARIEIDRFAVERFERRPASAASYRHSFAAGSRNPPDTILARPTEQWLFSEAPNQIVDATVIVPLAAQTGDVRLSVLVETEIEIAAMRAGGECAE
jgi:hypothetical protein